MIRATRPLSAPKRSASIATLLALGSAATSTMATSAADDNGRPSRVMAMPTSHTISGCPINLTITTGR